VVLSVVPHLFFQNESLCLQNASETDSRPVIT